MAALQIRLKLIEDGGRDTVIKAARNFRCLHAKGVTARKTIDTLIATWFIMIAQATLAPSSL